MAHPAPKGSFMSVASAVNAGTLSNNANVSTNVESSGGSAPTGSVASVASATNAGALSNAANVILS